MNYIIEPLIASLEIQSKAIGRLAELWLERAEMFTTLQATASLAAIDNTAHHLETLAMSKGIDDVVELQIKSVLPTIESVKAYAGQMLTWSEVTSRDLWQLVESNLTRL